MAWDRLVGPDVLRDQLLWFCCQTPTFAMWKMRTWNGKTPLSSNDSNISKLKKDSVFSQQASERKLKPTKEQLGTTWEPLFLLFIPFDYQFAVSLPKTTPRSLTRTPRFTVNRVTHFGHGQKSQFQVRAMEEILPRLQLQCELTGGFDDVYHVIKNMSTPEIFTCHSTFTSYQFSFYKEESYNHGLYMTII